MGTTAGRSGGKPVRVPADVYQQFDADLSAEVPAEAYGGWRTIDIDLDPAHTAVVVMHASDAGTPRAYPGWYRAVEYIPRAQGILSSVFPRLLSAVRKSPFRLFHVPARGDYYRELPGYRHALSITPETPDLPIASPDPSLEQLRALRDEYVFVGPHNRQDVARGFANLDFAPEARPEGHEGIAESAEQLFALCDEVGINHLIYAGFAINWCLLMSPGGMLDMSRRGIMCSAFRQAVTAVENRESARNELHKEEALWRVALSFGFVLDVDSFVEAMQMSFT